MAPKVESSTWGNKDLEGRTIALERGGEGVERMRR